MTCHGCGRQVEGRGIVATLDSERTVIVTACDLPCLRAAIDEVRDDDLA